MNLATVRHIARGKGVPPDHLCKRELIRAIQIAEGNQPCFGQAPGGTCAHHDCHWHEDCRRHSRRH
ncbi:MAG: SAP domain-containing protein [Ectothiorhodospira sp.]